MINGTVPSLLHPWFKLLSRTKSSENETFDILNIFSADEGCRKLTNDVQELEGRVEKYIPRYAKFVTMIFNELC